MSSGFDAADGDVGNCRNYPGLPCERGMDLSPEDFGWATAEVMKVADMCCAGKVVSVLEGGYGQRDPARANKSLRAPTSRPGTRYSGYASHSSAQVSVLLRNRASAQCRSF